MDASRVKKYLKDFEFKPLFTEELGWERHKSTLPISVDGESFTLNAIAQKRGLVAYLCSAGADRHIPDYATRRKIEQQVAKSVHEHLIVYTDAAQTTQVWQWVKREAAKPLASRETTFHRNQTGEALTQKLQALAFSLEEEENLALPHILGAVKAAFDVEKVTKKFYDRFKKERDGFEKFLKGIPDEKMQDWYVSVMLNRLMFIYFIQKKGFLDGDTNYLRNRLAASKKRGKDRFYKDFLIPLFFEGFAKRLSERSAATNALLGQVPYLNGGLFLRHQIEELHGKSIAIADVAFDAIFAFFDAYQWHLDERLLRNDNEINPDVLGYIFEKYINQKQMGAYYTKEDITEYISRNTVLPFLFDVARQKVKIAFEGEPSIWRLLQIDPKRYIFDSVKQGVTLSVPDKIAAGIKDVSKRSEWNKPAPSEYALPTEIWREVVTRRQRYEEVCAKLERGEIRDINDFITYNLNIRQFAQDVIENAEGPEVLRAFWHGIEQVTILDPTCGSGAFLFAALNILEPLYEACLDRMQAFLDELGRSEAKHRPEKFSDFREVLQRVAAHPNRAYFIFKSIVVNNLYGVDIMEEAVEICKLRLFLKLVAQVGSADKIEPLPDIDFNIRAGNTLVGYATAEQVKQAITTAEAGQIKMLSTDDLKTMQRIDESAEIADRAFQRFREMQTKRGMDANEFAQAKEILRGRLQKLDDELNRYLATEYGIDPKKQKAYDAWLKSHKPFHWFVEFYGILKRGGFDVIIGNPPYVEYSKVKVEYTIHGYKTESCGNLYAYVIERSDALVSATARFGMIIPVSSISLEETQPLRSLLWSSFTLSWASSFAVRPSKLFDGVDQRLCIYLTGRRDLPAFQLYTTTYHRWHAEERQALFEKLFYVRTEDLIFGGRVSKVANKTARSTIERVRSQKPPVDFRLTDSGGVILHYHRSPNYWIRAMDFEPFFKSPRADRSMHHFRDLGIVNTEMAKFIGAILNSSMFFFWFTAFSNNRNVAGIDVRGFPLGNPTEQIVEQVGILFDELMNDYERKSEILERKDVKLQVFYPSLSKPIMDDIDRALSKHFGFTDEELDFIINYDIKYRMGKDAGEEEE